MPFIIDRVCVAGCVCVFKYIICSCVISWFVFLPAMLFFYIFYASRSRNYGKLKNVLFMSSPGSKSSKSRSFWFRGVVFGCTAQTHTYENYSALWDFNASTAWRGIDQERERERPETLWPATSESQSNVTQVEIACDSMPIYIKHIYIYPLHQNQNQFACLPPLPLSHYLLCKNNFPTLMTICIVIEIEMPWINAALH